MNGHDKTLQSSFPFRNQGPVRKLSARLIPYNLAAQSPIGVVHLDQPRVRFGRASATVPADSTAATEPDKVVLERGEDGIEIRGDASISRDHARIEFVDGEWILRDEGSTNGTYVDGVRIVSCALRDGDRVGIGKMAVFHFCVVHEVVELPR